MIQKVDSIPSVPKITPKVEHEDDSEVVFTCDGDSWVKTSAPVLKFKIYDHKGRIKNF
jgi:hypothetical protein